jgi:hypothetical protein
LKKNYVKYYVIFSVTVALLLIILAFFSTSILNSITLNEKIILSLFIIIGCLYGISLAFHPGCLKKQKKILKQSNERLKTMRSRRGHHPDCEKFYFHTILINKKTMCTGCLGLSIGCLISIILVVFYLIFNISWSITILYFFIVLGLLLIFFAQIETIITRKFKILHIITNITFVLGFLFITIGIFEIKGQLIFGFLGIVLSVLWLDTRIHLSNWRHSLICRNCKEKCKMY